MGKAFLTPEKGLLFRITHIANLPWVLTNGLHCASSATRDPNFVQIGSPDLIAKRANRGVPIPPKGVLADYVPFYFTPRSPMLLNIKTGFNGVPRRPNEEIVILVSSCRRMRESGVTLLFTDRHAYTATAAWTDNPATLSDLLDWAILDRCDFARDDAYPDKMERYQAEALAHCQLPPGVIQGIGCVSQAVSAIVDSHMRDCQVKPRVVVRPEWYF